MYLAQLEIQDEFFKETTKPLGEKKDEMTFINIEKFPILTFKYGCYAPKLEIFGL